MEAVVSRRGDRAWGEFVTEHTFGGGEEYYVDWESAGRALGVPVEDFVDYNAEDGWRSNDQEGLRAAVRTAFDNPEGEEPPPLVVITLRCQRCDRRLGAFRIVSTRWVSHPSGEWHLEKPVVRSEGGVKLDGTGPILASCPCGRRGIQFSRQRIAEALRRLAPKEARWATDEHGDGFILRPETSHESIVG